MDEPEKLEFVVLQLSKYLMYETNYDKLQAYFGGQKMQLLYGDTESFVLNLNTIKTIMDLYNLKDFFDFSNLNNDLKLFSNEHQKTVGIFKTETPKDIWIEDFIV